jgi:hypothetical protein
MVAVAVVRHGRQPPLPLPEPEPLPDDEPPDDDPLPDPPPPVPVPEVEPVEPAPVSVLTGPLGEPGMVAVVEGVVVDTVDEVVSLVVGDVDGVVVLVTDEPGVALAPELLLALVPAPLLQPARPAVARAAAAMYGISRFMEAPFRFSVEVLFALRAMRGTMTNATAVHPSNFPATA